MLIYTFLRVKLSYGRFVAESGGAASPFDAATFSVCFSFFLLGSLAKGLPRVAAGSGADNNDWRWR